MLPWIIGKGLALAEGGIVSLRMQSLPDGVSPLDVVPITVATFDSVRIRMHAISSIVEDHLVGCLKDAQLYTPFES